LRIADLVDDDPLRDRVSAALKDPAKEQPDHVTLSSPGMAKEGFD
jgi:hypothetical protein